MDVIAVGGDGDAPPLCGRMPGHLSGLRVWLPAQPALSVSCTVKMLLFNRLGRRDGVLEMLLFNRLGGEKFLKVQLFSVISTNCRNY